MSEPPEKKLIEAQKLYIEAVELYKRLNYPNVFAERSVLSTEEIQEKFDVTINDYIKITGETKLEVIDRIVHECFNESINKI